MSLSTLLEAAKYLDYLDSNNQHQHSQQKQSSSSSITASPSQQQQQQQTHTYYPIHQQQIQIQHTHATGIRKTSSRRQRSSSKKDAANTMLAMSLPASTGQTHPLASHYKLQGVPIPLAGSASGSSSAGGVVGGSGVGSAGEHHRHHAASLSSSFTTGSPLSSFASTALLCSKASGATFGSSSSSSSSAASSLSSSDLSSSCGEILMADNEIGQPTTVMIGQASTGTSSGTTSARRGSKKKNNQNNSLSSASAVAAASTLTAAAAASYNSNIATSQHNYHLTHQPQQHHHPETNPQHIQSKSLMQHQFGNNRDRDPQQSVACYIAVTSAGPQLVTMSSSPSFTSTSAPIDGRARAGHVIHAATSGASGTSFESRHFSIANGGIKHETPMSKASANTSAYGLATSASANPTMSGDSHLSSSPNGGGGHSCGPLIMARVQPMILNSLSPPAHQGLMAFQSTATASSPTSSSSSYSRHRELHKTLEKNRRAHLRHCFELLRAELPASEYADKKTSHINIIKLAIRYVIALRQQEYELDNELQRLTKIKTELTEKLSMRGEQGSAQQQHQQQQQQEHRDQNLEQAMRQQQSSSASESQMEQSQQQPQQPVAEQQLSLLLSQSKID